MVIHPSQSFTTLNSPLRLFTNLVLTTAILSQPYTALSEWQLPFAAFGLQQPFSTDPRPSQMSTILQ